MGTRVTARVPSRGDSYRHVMASKIPFVPHQMQRICSAGTRLEQVANLRRPVSVGLVQNHPGMETASVGVFRTQTAPPNTTAVADHFSNLSHSRSQLRTVRPERAAISR